MGVKEVHNAIVLDNSASADPSKRGGIRVQIDAIIPGQEYPSTAYPSFPYAGNNFGFFFVPKIGEMVEVEVETGDDIVMHSDVLQYRSTLYAGPSDVPEEFKKNYPFRMGIKTESEHILLFDDKRSKELVKLFWKGKHGIELNANGVFFGDDSASENMVLGQIWKTISVNLISAWLTHTHVPPIGGPPDAATVGAVTAELNKIIADTPLSDFIKGMKVQPK